MIEYYVKSKNKEKIEKVESFKSKCWTNIINPTEQEIEMLEKKYDLERNNLIDGLDIHENPRLEIKNKKIYLFLTIPTEKIKHEHDSSFLIIFSKDAIFTVSKYSLEIFNHILSTSKKFIKFSSTRNLLRILFYLSRSFEKSVHKIMKETRKNKVDLNKLKNKDVAKLIEDEDKLNNYIASFGLTIQIYNKLIREKSVKFTEKDKEIIEDLVIDLSETLGLCKQTLKTISNMREYYTTRLSNELNNTVKVLTIFTIFLSIPTLIASIYGMNVILPWQSSNVIYLILGGFLIGFWILMFFILKFFKIL